MAFARRNGIRLAVMMLLAVTLVPSTAAAYVGPGSGVTVIGAALALVGSVILAILGFIWYPLKRLLQARRRARSAEGATVDV